LWWLREERLGGSGMYRNIQQNNIRRFCCRIRPSYGMIPRCSVGPFERGQQNFNAAGLIAS
jgi:hypothetical protein